MTQPDPQPPAGGREASTIDRAGAARVGIASAVAAGTSTVVVLGAPGLLGGTADVTAFLTFWSALFTGFGLLSGLSVETTRAAAAARDAQGTAGRHPRVGTVGAAAGLGLGALLAAGAALWGPAVFPRAPLALACLVALGVAGYAVHSVVVGALAGTGRWTVYARLVTADSLVRLLLVAGLAAAALAATGSRASAATAGAAGAAVAAFTWAGVVAVSRTARAAAASRVDVPWGPYLRRLVAASTATGASALLVVGFPTLLAVTTPTDAYATAAPLLLALTLTRAPLLVPLNAYQGVAVAHVVRHRERGLRALLPVVRAVAVVGALGSLAAWAVGPWLLALVGRSEEYRLDGTVVAGLTLGATAVALLTLTGAVCQALTRHGTYVAGWLVAVAVALVLLLLPLPMEPRAVIALCCGPLVGGVVHLVGLRRGGTPPGGGTDDDR